MNNKSSHHDQNQEGDYGNDRCLTHGSTITETQVVSSLGPFGRLFFGLLTLLSQPAMFFNPFFRFSLGGKLAEVARALVWPRYFDAPTI
jgi:hypothetical protein